MGLAIREPKGGVREVGRVLYKLLVMSALQGISSSNSGVRLGLQRRLSLALPNDSSGLPQMRKDLPGLRLCSSSVSPALTTATVGNCAQPFGANDQSNAVNFDRRPARECRPCRDLRS